MSGRDIEKSICREMSGDLESGMLAVGKNTHTHTHRTPSYPILIQHRHLTPVNIVLHTL